MSAGTPTAPSARGRRPRGAFTLIEALVAIALLLALLGAMFGFFFDMLSSRARALDHMWRDQAASTLINKLEADLACCIVGDSRTGGGVRGGPSTLRILSRGVAVQVAERGIDDPAVLGDLQFTEYRHDQATHLLLGRAGPASEIQSQQDRELSSGTVHRLRFRYHDGQGWRDSFDSLQAGRLPLAVEVAIWFTPSASSSAAATSSDSTQDAEHDQDEESEIQSAEHPPDRIRVLVIPDAGANEMEGSANA